MAPKRERFSRERRSGFEASSTATAGAAGRSGTLEALQSDAFWESPDRFAVAISGIGAYQILAPETGLHVFESPHDEHSFVVRRSTSRLRRAGRLLLSPIRPLVRDTVRDWRTGRLDRVLAGEFDVFAER